MLIKKLAVLLFIDVLDQYLSNLFVYSGYEDVQGTFSMTISREDVSVHSSSENQVSAYGKSASKY